jgi:hypothetical protein
MLAYPGLLSSEFEKKNLDGSTRMRAFGRPPFIAK